MRMPFFRFRKPQASTGAIEAPRQKIRLGEPLRDRISLSVPVAPSPRRNVLIIDDDPVFQKAAANCLVSAGYAVAHALDISEALGAVKTTRPDVILLDLCFPPDPSLGGGWNGLQIMQWMRGLRDSGQARFIVVTASDPVAIRDKALALGARAFLQKPAGRAELLATVEAALAD
jgi:CheY-like chemotaxis protein